MSWKLIIILVFSTFLSGCAAMFNGTTEQVTIRSHDPKAKIFVNGAYKGKGDVVTTFKKKKDYTIMVKGSSEKCESVTIPASKSFDATTLLGIFIDFGIVSILVVDGAGTGAWQKFDQTNYVIDAKCPEVA